MLNTFWQTASASYFLGRVDYSALFHPILQKTNYIKFVSLIKVSIILIRTVVVDCVVASVIIPTQIF